MATESPFSIEAVGWNDLPDSERDFFCFEEEYLPLPATHAAQISRLKSADAQRVWQWLSPSIPSGWPDHEKHFPNETTFSLNDEHWESEAGNGVVRRWLHERDIPYATHVFLIYESGKIIQMPWKLTIKYWDALAWSIGYSMFVMDQTRQWACCFHHENVIVFGTYLNTPTGSTES